MKQIPNLFTLLNLFFGCIAIVYTLQSGIAITADAEGTLLLDIPEKIWMASLFIGLAAVVDFLDGFVARLFKASSEMGKQLDSLADLVTSGVVPGVIMFKLISLTVDAPDYSAYNDSWNSVFHWQGFKISVLPLIGLFIALASAYRLAKFNLDEDQQTYFKGLPVPANTLVILSLPLILEYQNNDLINSIIINKWFLIGLTLLSCYLLNSKIKLFALKFNDWSFKNNATRYIFLIISVVMLIVLRFAAIPLIIALYIILSLLDRKNIH